MMAALITSPEWAGTIESEGWADAAELERIRAAAVAWGERPEAFTAVMYCAAVGWVDA